jgi:DUF4097 and DUF4098 domain-containing protein YvlB
MTIRTTASVLVAALTLAGGALPAQSSREREREREIERRAEQLGRSIERTVQQTVDMAMRAAEQAVRGVDHRYDGLQQGGSQLDTTVSFPRDGTVDLTAFAGDIIVTGWNRSDARVRASSERGRLRWRITASRITLETEMVRGRTGDTRYEVTVPEGTRVIMRSNSGDLTIRGLRGSVDAHTTSGDITITDVDGTIEIQTLNGDVNGTRLRGTIEAGSVSGSVELDDVQGRSIRFESTGGDLTLTNASARDVYGSTVGGDLEYRGVIEPGGQYEFHSHSGSITLAIPSNASARFSIETFSGELDSDFPVTLQPDRDNRRGRRLEFNLGGGDARVIAETFSGSVEIRRDSRR